MVEPNDLKVAYHKAFTYKSERQKWRDALWFWVDYNATFNGYEQGLHIITNPTIEPPKVQFDISWSVRRGPQGEKRIGFSLLLDESEMPEMATLVQTHMMLLGVWKGPDVLQT